MLRIRQGTHKRQNARRTAASARVSYDHAGCWAGLLAVAVVWLAAGQTRADEPSTNTGSEQAPEVGGRGQTGSAPGDLGSWLFVGQAGLSPWGTADNYPASEDHGEDVELGDYGTMKGALDVRLGADWLPTRWFSASLSLGASRWQTELFESLGRGRSYTFDATLMPRFRIPLSRRHPGFALFVGVGAGPAVSNVSDSTAHVRVSEHARPRLGYAAAWT